MTTIKNVAEGEKSSKAQLDVLVPIKSTTTTEEEKGGKIQQNLQNKSKKKSVINVLLGSLLSESSPSLGVTVPLTSLGCPPTLLISGPAVGAAQILIWSYSCVFLHSVSTAIRARAFSFVGALSGLLYIPLDTESAQLIMWI